MGDLTITARNKPKNKRSKPSSAKGDSNRGRPKVDAWAQTMDGEYNCIFCGHDAMEHGALRLMVRKEGNKNRQTVGLYHLNCLHCAKDKNTSQAVCYKVADSILDSMREHGYQVC